MRIANGLMAAQDQGHDLRPARLIGCERHLPDTGGVLIDFDLSGGAVLLGHAHPQVEAAASTGSAEPSAVASALQDLVPGAEDVRFVAEEAHALPAALAAARRLTGRRRAVAWQTRPMPLQELDDLAALVVDTLGATAEDMAGARRLADAMGVPLIFDEGVSSFRVHARGVQGLTGVQPDLAVYGASISNGRPLGAIAGRAGLIDAIQPEDLTQPRAESLAAAHATLSILAANPIADRLTQLGQALIETVAGLGSRAASDPYFKLGGQAVLPTPYFATPQTEGLWLKEMRARGVYVFGPHGLCAAHNERHIELICLAYASLLPIIAATGMLGVLRASNAGQTEKGGR